MHPPGGETAESPKMVKPKADRISVPIQRTQLPSLEGRILNAARRITTCGSITKPSNRTNIPKPTQPSVAPDASISKASLVANPGDP